MSSKEGTRSQILDAALAMVRQGADPTMAGVAAKAGVSRQAVYLHFQDRGALLLALVQHADQGRGVAAKLAAIAKAPSARAAVASMVALGASDNPGLWPVERILDSLCQGKDVLLPVVADQCLTDGLHGGMAAWITQGC